MNDSILSVLKCFSISDKVDYKTIFFLGMDDELFYDLWFKYTFIYDLWLLAYQMKGTERYFQPRTTYCNYNGANNGKANSEPSNETGINYDPYVILKTP